METNETIDTTVDTTSAATELPPVAVEENTGVDTPIELQAAPEDVPDSFLENFNLDSLLKADFSDDEIMSQTHKGLPEYNEILKHLPLNGRKLIANLRAMTTQKTQEVAEIRRDLKAQQDKLLQERKALYDGKFAENVATAAAEPEKPFDLFSTEGMESKIKQEAAKMFQNMLKPMQEEMFINKRSAALENFKRDNPDLMDPDIKMGVARLLRDRGELKLEDAYYITKAKMNRERLVTLEDANRLQRDKAKETWNKTSNGSNVSANGTPQFRDAWESYQWHKANGVK